jgi:hypothetical protein
MTAAGVPARRGIGVAGKGRPAPAREVLAPAGGGD